MHQPTVTHWAAAKSLLYYLEKMIFLGIHINHQSSFIVTTFVDVDWARNYDDHTSTSAYITFLGSNPISWSSKKQRVVARSSTQVEYCSLATATSEIIWLLSYSKNFVCQSTLHHDYYVITWDPHTLVLIQFSIHGWNIFRLTSTLYAIWFRKRFLMSIMSILTINYQIC
jgi:hypothetical protein